MSRACASRDAAIAFPERCVAMRTWLITSLPASPAASCMVTQWGYSRLPFVCWAERAEPWFSITHHIRCLGQHNETKLLKRHFLLPSSTGDTVYLWTVCWLERIDLQPQWNELIRCLKVLKKIYGFACKSMTLTVVVFKSLCYITLKSKHYFTHSPEISWCEFPPMSSEVALTHPLVLLLLRLMLCLTYLKMSGRTDASDLA